MDNEKKEGRKEGRQWANINKKFRVTHGIGNRYPPHPDLVYQL